MKKIIWKAYVNFEKEEKWLNDMAAKGWAMVAYSWCRYVFEECEPGEYFYRIEMLAQVPDHPGSMSYLSFLEENGVEFVASYFRWAYFRKKSVDGPFSIYSDIDSQISHLQRVTTFANTFACIEFTVGAVNLSTRFWNTGEVTTNMIIGGILIGLGFVFVWMGYPARKYLKRLRKEKNIRE